MDGVSKYDDTSILHNAGSKQIKKPESLSKLHRFKTQCLQCKSTMQRVCRLLDEINIIMENEVIGVCEYCKRATSLTKTCKSCEFIVSEFKSRKETQQRFKVWLCKVYHVLQAIVDGESVCKQGLYKDMELERILHALKEPLHKRELDIDSFLNLGQEKLMSLQDVSESKEMLQELFYIMEFEGEKPVSSSESPSYSEEMCLCKYLKAKSGVGSKKNEDSVLTWEPLKNFSRTLRQEGHENLMKRLLDLSKALPQELHLNGDLLNEIVETINTALKQVLPQNIVSQLIKNLTELNKTLSDDLSEHFNTKVTQQLIDDLNDVLLLGSSKNLNHNLIKFLVDLSNLLTHERCKDLNKEALGSKNKMPQKVSLDCSTAVAQKINNLNKALTARAIDENLVQQLSSDIHEAIGRMPPNELNEIKKELTNFNKSVVQGTSKTENLKSIQGLLPNARKALDIKPKKDQNKKMVANITNLNKSLTSNKAELQKRSSGLTKNISKNVSKVLRPKHSTGKIVIKTAGHVESLNKRFSDSETGVAIKKTKSKISASKKTFTSSDKKSKKKELDRADNRDMRQYLFLDRDTESSKKKVKKLTGKKEKENLPPVWFLKSQRKQKSRELQKDAREFSESQLIKIQAKEENFKFKKHRQLVKQAEKKMTKDKQMSEKVVRKQNQIIQPLSSRNQIALDQQIVITISGEPPLEFDTKELEEQGEDLKPLPTSAAARCTSQYQALCKDGALKYQLSNEVFIRKGWTVVPKEKIMRRMNIYKMEPTNSQNCWFDRHKEHGQLFYDSGQKLADIDENGRGKWYYRNGSIALDYYNAQESNIGQRYVVYSSGTECDGGKIRPRTVLALFDVLGNCVVYDLRGNVRLKYNQSEGVLVDPKIGPPGKWKWHTLNDPPVLQRILVDTYLEERDPTLERIKETPSGHETHESEVARITHSDMVAIELDNFVKEKMFKLKQKFRPFKIRMKNVKLNEQFSLKIIVQATIYLLYRDGVTNLKLNLGMLLKSDEIIDTVISDVGDVPTPYDVRPAKSESVDNIQKILKSVRSAKL